MNIMKPFGCPSSWGRLSIWTAFVAAGVVLLTGSEVPAAATPRPDASVSQENPSEPDAPEAEDAPLTAADPVTALTIARLEDQPVEVMSERTETGSVFALPDGTMAASVSSGPVWVRLGGDGLQEADWAAVDLTLTQSEDGLIRPAAHPGDVALSGGTPEGETAGPDGADTEAAPAGVDAEATDPAAAADPESADGEGADPETADPETNTDVPDAETQTPDAEGTPASAPVTVAELVAADGSTTALSWDGPLPEPRIEGHRAVYEEVRPGIDLVVDVTASGFEQFFVLKERPEQGAELSLPLQVSTEGAATRPVENGAVEIVGADGEVAARVGEALMWDADADATRAHPVTTEWTPVGKGSGTAPMPDWASLRSANQAATPGRDNGGRGRNPGEAPGASGEPHGNPHGEAVLVESEVEQLDGNTVEIDLQPQEEVLQDPAVEYPVVLDPEFYLGIGFDTSVQSNVSSDLSASGDLYVGSWNSGSTVTRSFLRVNTAPIIGKRILDSKLYLYNYYSATCQARNWEVWHTGDVSTSTRWAAQPTWISQQAVVSTTRGYSSACGEDWVTAPVTGAMAWAASHSYQTMTLGLRASNEADSAAWKKFLSSENGEFGPTVWVNYASNPETPANLMVSPVGDTTNNIAYTSTLTPTLTANVNDGDGGNLTVTFEVLNGTTVEATGTVTAPAGSVAQWKVPGGELAEGTTYTMRVKASDGVGTSATATKQFSVDTTVPGAPFVTSTDFPDDGEGHGTPGVPGTVTLTHAQASDGSLVRFRWALDGPPDPAKTVPVVAATTSTTLTITPMYPGRHVLRVQAVDRAGNTSGVAEHTFYVGHNGAMISPADGQTVGKEVRIELAPPAGYTRVEIRCDYVDSSPEPHPCLGSFTTSSGAPWTNNAEGNIPEPGDYVILHLNDAGLDAPEKMRIGPDFYGGGFPASVLWPTVIVDPGQLAAASAGVGPGSVNLATGDHVLSATDVEEFGLVVSRTSSSRDPKDGYEKQTERLLPTQQTASSLASIYPGNSTLAIDTNMYRTGGSSLRITPGANSSAYGSYASIGGDVGGMRLGMQAGHTYEISGWIHDQWSAAPPLHERGLKLGVHYKTGAGTYVPVLSQRATVGSRWQKLTVTVTIPYGSTEAFVRLYNGYNEGSNKFVHFDDLSVREVWAPFGPEWSSGVGDMASGTSFTKVSRPFPDVAAVGLVGGGDVYFLSEAGGPWRPMAGAEGLSLTQTVSGGTTTGWTLTDVDGTITTFVASSGTKDFPVATTSPGVTDSTATRYVYEIVGGINRLKRIIAPIEPGVAGTPNSSAPCTGDPPAVGCEVLEYIYATSTMTSISGYGSFAGQVSSIRVSTTPDITAARATWQTVACFRYDQSGRLGQVWDPRITNSATCTSPTASSLYTQYAYDSAGRVTSVTPSGEPPYTFAYGTSGTDSNAGRLLTVSRASVVTGTKSQLGPVNTSRVVYGVPLTRADGGPYDLDDAAVSQWAQNDGPVMATAIFGPQFDPGVSTATAGNPSVAQYQNSEVHYLNTSGQEVNTASPIGQASDAARAAGYIDTAEYNSRGAVIRTLDASNRLAALRIEDSPAFEALDDWGLQDRTSIELSQLFDSRNTYSSDGMDLLESLGPVQQLAMANDPEATALLRPVVTSLYDQGKPDGAAYHLLTTSTSAGRPLNGGADVDVVSTVYTYNPIDGANPLGRSSGWVHKQPTMVTVAAGTPNAVTARVLYDTRGRVVESRKAGSSGSDAGTTRSIYYTAGANPADTACGGRPDWAGSPCKTMAAGKVTGFRPNYAHDELPTRWVQAYNVFGTPTVVTEGAAGASRTTTTTYDSADRVTSVQISGAAAGTAIPTTTTTYDPTSGDVVAVTGNGPTGSPVRSITKEYDVLGRLVAYGDADGGRTETDYDRYGKPIVERQLQNGTQIGSRTFEYDMVAEPRGLLTAITDSVAGRIGATWGPDGQLLSETLPGGVTLSITYDPATVPVQRQYTRTSDDAVIWNDAVIENHRGQWIQHTSTTGEASYAYDDLGRLAAVEDRVGGTVNTCTRRTYGYDLHSNRTSYTSVAGVAGQNLETAICPTSGGTLTTSVYDSADRLVEGFGGPHWVYDQLGRITLMPSLANGNDWVLSEYYVNDLVASQTMPGKARVEWGLDPIQRRNVYEEFAWINEAWASTVEKVSHYSSDSDEPGWIVEDATEPDNAITRYVSGVEGDLAVSTSRTGDRELQLVDLHGDVVGTLPIADGAAEATWAGLEFSRTDEFGKPVSLTGGATPNAPPARYGWLGAAQRSAEALGGLILMGVRVYHPSTGRFLSPDPVPGGSASAYDYCTADPINCTDLAGTFSFGGLLDAVAKVAEVASIIPGPIGAAAAGVSAVAYAARGNTAKAIEMGVTAAAALVGAGAVVRVAARAVNVARAAGSAVRGGSKIARTASQVGERASAALQRVRNVVRRGCNSFVPGTLVVLADGTVAPIETLEVGDLVLTRDPETGETSSQPVITPIVGTGDKHLVEIVTDAGTWTATDNHPVWVDGKGWVNAVDLTTGDRLVGSTGGILVVRAMHDLGWLSEQTVYNLSVAGTHTYYVVAGDGTHDALVHNGASDAACPRGGAAGTVVEERGVRIRIYSRDHGPAHAHVTGRGPEVRIGQNGKPLARGESLSRAQRAVVQANIRLIRAAVRRSMAAYRAR